MTSEAIRKNLHASERCPKREGDEGATEHNTIPSSTTHDKEDKRIRQAVRKKTKS
jgi:hypothetical protein